jgi:hypothetical protein
MSASRAIVDKLLTNVSQAYIPEGFVCEQLLPQITVAQFTGKIGKYGTSHLRIVNSVVGGKGRFRQVETIVRDSDTYSIEGHGLEGIVTLADYANVEKPFDAERDETMGISTVLWLEKEKGLADTLGSTAVMTQNTTLAGTSQLSDYDNSDPIGVFSAARLAIFNGCGAIANVAIMDYIVWDKLRYHPDLLDALGFKYDRPGGLSEQEMASVLGVERVIIAKARYESANEGQTSVLASVWGKNIIMAVLPKSAAPMQTSLGYRLQLAGQQPRKVSKWDNNNPSGSRSILVEDYYDMFIGNAKAGYLIKDAIA